MQVATSKSNSSIGNREVKRLTPADYSKAGILKLYDWSVKDREAHDKEMEKYRKYLMKLCTLSQKAAGSAGVEDE
jgi:hypothetical protein